MDSRTSEEQGLLSPTRTTRMISSKSLQESKSPQRLNKDSITTKKQQIDQFLYKLDQQLKNNYISKQQKLIGLYRQQILQAHRQLNELKTKTNEKQILSEFEEKKLNMKKQRLELVEINMFLSNKCQQLKKDFNQQVTQGAEYERQIRFIQSQIQNAARKKVQLMTQIYQKGINKVEKSHNQFHANNQLSKFLGNKTRKTTFDYQQPLSQRKTDKILNSTNLQHAQIDTIQSKRSYVTSTQNSKPNNQSIMSFFKNPNSKIQTLSKKQENSFTSQTQKIFDSKLATNIKIQDKFFKKSISRVASQCQGEPSRHKTLIDNRSRYDIISPLAPSQQKQRLQLERCFQEMKKKIKQRRTYKKVLPTLCQGQQFRQSEKKEIVKAFISQILVKKYIYSVFFGNLQALEMKRSDRKLFGEQNLIDMETNIQK